MNSKIESIISSFNKKYDIISLITPENLNEENNKFLKCFEAGREYNPQYKYSKDNISELLKYETVFQDIYNKKSNIKIIQDVLFELLISIKLIRQIGQPDITIHSKEIFGYPDNSIIKKANEIINKNNRYIDNKKIYTVDYLANIFKKRLKSYGFNWSIIITPNLSSSIAVDFENYKILLNKNDKFSLQDIKRFQVHEIDTHVLRAENGKRQPNSLFKVGFPNFIETEEGFATYNENRYGLLDNNTLRLYAGRVLGVNYALNHDFYSTFVYLNQFFDKSESIKIVSRVKRGISDTSQNGAFTKDYVYLNGYNDITNNLDSFSISLLYSGLVSYKYLEYIKEQIDYSRIIEPNPYFYE